MLRALIDEGLKRHRDGAVLRNIEGQVRAVREIRSRLGRDRGGRKYPRTH